MEPADHAAGCATLNSRWNRPPPATRRWISGAPSRSLDNPALPRALSRRGPWLGTSSTCPPVAAEHIPPCGAHSRKPVAVASRRARLEALLARVGNDAGMGPAEWARMVVHRPTGATRSRPSECGPSVLDRARTALRSPWQPGPVINATGRRFPDRAPAVTQRCAVNAARINGWSGVSWVTLDGRRARR